MCRPKIQRVPRTEFGNMNELGSESLSGQRSTIQPVKKFRLVSWSFSHPQDEIFGRLFKRFRGQEWSVATRPTRVG